jgi:hypothetical protein
VSPNYYGRENWTLYAQLEANVSPAAEWRVTAHAGTLIQLYASDENDGRRRRRYDWRLGVARELGNVEVHADLSGGGPGRQYYYGESHSRTALTAGASVSF